MITFYVYMTYEKIHKRVRNHKDKKALLFQKTKTNTMLKAHWHAKPCRIPTSCNE